MLIAKMGERRGASADGHLTGGGEAVGIRLFAREDDLQGRLALCRGPGKRADKRRLLAGFDRHGVRNAPRVLERRRKDPVLFI